MSSDNNELSTSSRISLGIFAAIGLLVVVSILGQMISGSFTGSDVCTCGLSTAYPSPNGNYDAVLRYKSCSQSGSASSVELGSRDNPGTLEILLKIEHQGLQATYPGAIRLRWLDSDHLEIHAPKTYLPSYSRTDSFGATVTFKSYE